MPPLVIFPVGAGGRLWARAGLAMATGQTEQKQVYAHVRLLRSSQ